MIKITELKALPCELYLESYFEIYGTEYWARGLYDSTTETMKKFHITCLDDESKKIKRLDEPYIIGLDILRKMDLKKQFRWEL
jgi:hypothetical protein